MNDKVRNDMKNKALFTVADIKKAFPEYNVHHSDDPAPSGAFIIFPRAMFASLALAEGTLATSVHAYWGSDKRIKFTAADEEDAQKAIEEELLPAWKAAGFEPTGERGFRDDTPGAEPEYIVTLKKTVQTMEDMKQALQWIAKDAETHVRA